MADGQDQAGAPIVSVLMANHNGALYLEAALKSVLEQTLAELEVIVVDDASTDRSRDIVEHIARQDRRVRLIARAQAGGPAAARNQALEAARGRFVAIVDSDDLVHPERLERLVAHARQDRAGIVADDLMIFEAKGGFAPHRLFTGKWARKPQWVDCEQFVDANHLYAKGPILGFVKPLIARDILVESGLRYDERLRIGEDFDFLARLLELGYFMRLYPELSYFYRKHAQSVSHRLDPNALMALRENAIAFTRNAPNPDLRRRHKRRLRSIERALAYQELVGRAKGGGALALLAGLRRHRAGLALLRLPILARLARLSPKRPWRTRAPDIVFITQAPLSPRPGAVWRYLAALAHEWTRCGRRVRVVHVGAMAATMTRLPSDGVYERIEVLGAWALGRWRLGLRDKRPRPDAAERALFLMRHAYGARAMVVDAGDASWATLGPIAGEAPRFTLASALIEDGIVPASALTPAQTIKALVAQSNGAPVIVPRMADEFDDLADVCPDLIFAPSPLAVSEPHVGASAALLFVGCNSAANHVALRWFAQCAWPPLKARLPELEFWIAGPIATRFESDAPDIIRINPDRTGEAMRRAALLIRPDRVASDARRQIETALACGKVVLASPTAASAVGAALRGALVIAESAEDFAERAVDLMADPAKRLRQAQIGCDLVRRTRLPAACYRALNAMLGRPTRLKLVGGAERALA